MKGGALGAGLLVVALLAGLIWVRVALRLEIVEGAGLRETAGRDRSEERLSAPKRPDSACHPLTHPGTLQARGLRPGMLSSPSSCAFSRDQA